MVQEHGIGKIVDINEQGVATIRVPLPNLNHALDRKYDDVEIIFPDGRRITPKQRRFCYMLLGAIAEYVDGIRCAETIEDAKETMKWSFILERMESQERRLFSLSDCDETLARNFLDYLISFIIKHDIPTSFSLLENCEDIGRYVYYCLMAKRCAICGKPADLHHVQSVGSQGYRDKISHIGMQCLPLCRVHHTESHKIGQDSFMGKYHLESVAIDEKIAKVYKLKA